MKNFLFILLVCALVACSSTRGSMDSIELPSGSSIEVANQIIDNVLNKSFYETVKQQFPELTNDELDGLSLSSRIINRLDAEDESVVLIIIGIQFKGELKEARNIIQFAKSLVQKEIANQFSDKSDQLETEAN